MRRGAGVGWGQTCMSEAERQQLKPATFACIAHPPRHHPRAMPVPSPSPTSTRPPASQTPTRLVFPTCSMLASCLMAVDHSS